MSTAKRLVTSAAAILLLVSTVCAQGQSLASSSRSTITVTAAATADRVRFTAPSTVVQMRIEVYAANGEKLFDNEIRGGNVIDWHLQDGQAERLSDGSYLCVITSKSLSGRMSQKLGRITIENAAASVQPIDTTQLTAQQTQAVGPLEENASLTVLKEGETQTATVIAHNGDDGQITRGKGALSFRIGDFFSGKDTEQMRLTAEGNLGIGITNPQVRLDVDGVIRASQGIIFPDGTTQYSAASKTLGAKSTMPDQVSDQILGGKHKFQTESVTQNHIAKFTDGGGTLGDSVITETAGGLLGIGTPSPDSLLNIQGTVPSLLGHMSVIRTTGSNNGFGLLMDSTGSGNNNLGLAVGGSHKAAFSWDNSRNFLGFVNFNYSANDFSLRVNADGSLTYHDGVSSAELFRITAAGNVGIGTNNSAAKLDVAGDINTSTQYNIGGSRVLSIPGNSNTTVGLITGITGGNNSFFGAAAGSNNTTGLQNSYFGVSAGRENLIGAGNSFFGYEAGRFTTGSLNTFFGFGAGTVNTIGGNNTFIGSNSNPSSNNLTFATAIGSGAVVSTSNTITLGRSSESVQIPGALGVGIASPLFKLHVKTGTDQDLVVRPGADFPGVLTGIAIQSINDVNSVYKPLDLEGSQITLNVGSAGNVGIGTAGPGEKLTVAGRVHSTSGGFKFPDGTVQTTAANATYTTTFIGNAVAPVNSPAGSIGHLDPPAGTYKLLGTIRFFNNANFFNQDNSRIVFCGFTGDQGSSDILFTIPGNSWATVTLHSVVTSSGRVNLDCGVDTGGGATDSNVTAGGRITAVKIEGNVVLQ